MYTGDTNVNIVVMKIVRLADAPASSSAAVADDISPYSSLNALLGYTSPREYQDINFVSLLCLRIKTSKRGHLRIGEDRG